MIQIIKIKGINTTGLCNFNFVIKIRPYLQAQDLETKNNKHIWIAGRFGAVSYSNFIVILGVEIVCRKIKSYFLLFIKSDLKSTCFQLLWLIYCNTYDITINKIFIHNFESSLKGKGDWFIRILTVRNFPLQGS